MNYKLESINGCTKKIVFDFAQLDLSSEIKQAVLNKQKDANLKGFRKGKAPVALVEKVFGPQIESDALNSFIQNQVFTAINKEKLRVVGYPSLGNLKYDTGKSVSFDATIEVFPELKVKDFSGLSFSREKSDVTDEDISNLKKNYLSSKAQMVEERDANKGIANGHYVVVNFQGTRADGSKPENMKGTEYLLEIGSNTFIPGFENGLLGAKKGEKKVLELTFPADYHMAELKNEKVKFDVEVLEVKSKVYPDFTDELAKEFGHESVADFEKKNKDAMKKQKERQSLQNLHQKILEKLVADNSFDVPSSMIVQQEKHVKDDLANNLKQQGFNDKMVEEYFSKWSIDVKDKATFQVKSGLILDALAQEYKIETSEKDLDNKLEEMASTGGVTLEEVKKFYKGNENLKKNLMYAIREEKTFEKIKEKLKIS